MFRHRFLPKRVPEGIIEGTAPLLRIDPSRRDVTRLFAKNIGENGRARKADAWFLNALYRQYGLNPFVRGDLDAGRLNRLFEREIIAADKTRFSAESFAASLRINPELISDWLAEDEL